MSQQDSAEPRFSLSPKEAIILGLLIANGEMYGLEMVKASTDLNRNTIYVTLDRMAEKGLVTSRPEKAENQSGMPRRMFSATGPGVRVLKAWQRYNAVLREVFA